MNFLELVNEVLLLEDPDHAVIGKTVLRYNEDSARPFLVMNVNFSEPKSSEKVLFYSLKPWNTHEDLRWQAMEYIEAKIDPERLEQAEDIDSQWDCYPPSIKDRMREAAKNWDREKFRFQEPYEVKKAKRYSDLNLLSGRYWIKDNKFLMSFWKGEDSDIKKWIKPVLSLWNPENFPILYQAPGSENWEDGNKFLASSSSSSIKETPEIKKLQKEINKLLPQIHISTGEEKQKIKTQIKSLQKQIQSLGGRSSLSSEEPLKGSYKSARIAGDMSIAQMKASSQTSESFIK
jgi:hypothetical protein